ncbi:hypothetical protein ACM66B_003437 [Microbotryomycetes sp. NB124-2]
MNFVRNVISVSTETEDGPSTSGNDAGNDGRSSPSSSTSSNLSTKSLLHERLQTLRLRYDLTAGELVASRFQNTWDTWPRLRELWIVGAPLGVTWLTMTSLRDLAPTLVQLCLDNVGLLESESLSLPALCLPNLKHLALSNPIIFPTGRAAEPWQPFLNPNTCPRLESIVLSGWISTVRPEQLNSLNASLCSIAPQVKRFTFKPTAALDLSDLTPIYPHLHKLEFLGLPMHETATIPLAALPYSPQTIRFFAHFRPDEEMDAVETLICSSLMMFAWRECLCLPEWGGPLGTIKRFILPDLRHVANPSKFDKAYDSKVTTVEYRALPFDDYAIQWEDLVATGFGFE